MESVIVMVPEEAQLEMGAVKREGERLRMEVRRKTTEGICPQCGRRSRREQSRYERRVADVPTGGLEVELVVRVRRFVCENPECGRRIFAEQFPEVMERYSRRTRRLGEVIGAIGYAAGGEGGVRLGHKLGIRISADTILRQIRRPNARFTAGSGSRNIGQMAD